MSIQDIIEQNGIMIIDGSLSAPLEHMGCDLNDSLWTAKVLIEEPEKIEKVHYDYLRAGADCGITSSYQASIPGLTARGFSEAEAEELIAKTVKLFCSARDRWWNSEGRSSGRARPLCLASVGPYGAYLADGSEYTGNYGVSKETLRAFHEKRMRILCEAGADVLLMETTPSLEEALTEAELAEELGAEYWISFSCKDGSHTCEGDDITHCAELLCKGHPHLRMIGVNCTSPKHISQLIKNLKKAATVPIAVYPNSGETYDPGTKTWTSANGLLPYGELALQWMKDGASAVGGCCTTCCEHIEAVAKAKERFKSDIK